MMSGAAGKPTRWAAHYRDKAQKEKQEMKSIFPIYTEVNGSTEGVEDQNGRRAAIKDFHFCEQKEDSNNVIR